MTNQPPSQITGVSHFKPSKATMVVMGCFVVFAGASLFFLAYFVAFKLDDSFGISFEEGDPGLFFLFVLILFGIFNVVLGIGSIQAQRWARALLHALGWFLIGLSIFWLMSTTAVLAPLFSTDFRHINFSDLEYILIPLGILIGIPILLATPGALLLVIYKSKNTIYTCEHFHPKPSWTDRVPTSVLVLWLTLIGFATSNGLILICYFSESAITDKVTTVVLILMFLFLAFGLSKMSRWAYLGSIAMLITLSALFFIGQHAYRNMPDIPDPNYIIPIVIITACLGYLLWIRGHFFKRQAKTDYIN